MDLITRVIVKDPDGKVVAEGIIKSFHCENGMLTIETQDPQVPQIVSSVKLGGEISYDDWAQKTND
jgi:hypothetical protein